MNELFLGLDTVNLVIVISGALIAGFTTGFAGFGTGLVVAGFWFSALPPHMVPPLIVIAALSAQAVGLSTQRPTLNWRKILPFVIPGCLGVPIGIYALSQASPIALQLIVGGFLMAYAAVQFSGLGRLSIGSMGGRLADALVGGAGGLLGGFAGLSGPLPIVWLQIRGGPSHSQLAIYRPYSLVVLSMAAFGMAIGGHIDQPVLSMALLCTPFTLIGARIGSTLSLSINEILFRQLVLTLLLISGVALMLQSLTAS